MGSPSQKDNSIPTGQQRASSTWGDFNNSAFVIQQALGKLQTSTLVRIESCSNVGGVSPVGLVDVTPLINQLDALGNPTPHTTIHNVPYFRMQGGTNAVIMDPQKGDIGICVFASRDISKVKATRKQANPGSFRQYSFADGLYVGGVLNGTPAQYVQFTAEGITLRSPAKVRLDAPTVEIVAADVAITSSTLTHNGVNIGSTHTHGGVTVGGAQTDVPE